MEQIEIHSRSYLLRWVHAKSSFTISWTVQPHKRSINLGLFKHPGALASLPMVAGLPALSATSSRNEEELADQPEVVDKLETIGLKQIVKLGKCEADRFNQGRYDVPNGEGGHYALVFDNTFSKNTGKNVTFFLLTYPSKDHHQISFGAQLHHSQAMASVMSLAPPIGARKSPRIGTKPSADSLSNAADATSRSSPTPGAPQLTRQDSGQIFRGVLQKRRRKKGQGYARRFFSLDYTSSTLSYYHDRNSSALRGAIPLSLAAIGANAKTREISIDSGAEIWHLKANNTADFNGWKAALEKASQLIIDNAHTNLELDTRVPGLPISAGNDLNWDRLEALLSKMSGTRDAVRRLCNDTLQTPTPSQPTFADGATPTAPKDEADGYFPEERTKFWKRKPSGTEVNRNMFKRSVSAQLAVPAPSNAGPMSPGLPSPSPGHSNMREILSNLDSVIADFSSLIGEARSSNTSAVPQSAVSRMSLESVEYFDAEDIPSNRKDSQLLLLPEEESSDAEDKRSEDSDSSSDGEDTTTLRARGFRSGSLSALMPPPARSLAPLPLDSVRRRNTVKSPTIMPPSLIGFLRKNVGKDLSTISMPVSANEPTSLLQKAAENLEYSELLDKATTCTDPAERMLYITAFALSSFSNARVKERSIRKPFNPMLGETYELIREDKNFRFVSEKVSHRPVQLAYHAEGKNWSLAQSPTPSQKFWGKSSEIITEGKMRVVLNNVGECYSWTPATCFLRNIIAGEKYIEPVGTMSVINETTAWKCVITFKVKGMFSGRSEEVVVQMLDQNGVEQPLGLTGAWTSNLVVTENGRADASREIWHIGALVDRPEKHYGMTSYAAELNEITSIEQDKLPPTDSRLRTDQKALEDGRYEDAERLKNEIEEGQRARRRDMEANNEEWVPKFFVKVSSSDETVWKLKTGGPDGYWERRAKSNWSGIVDVLSVQSA